MKGFSCTAVLLLLLLATPLSGCNGQKSEPPEKLLGKNSHYFLALSSLKDGNEAAAVRHLRKGMRKSDDFFAQMCMEKLSTIGTVSERIATAVRYADEYPGGRSLLRAAQELTTGEEYDRIIAITEGCPDDAPHELIKLRLNAVAAKNRTAFAGEIEDWFLHHEITAHHRDFHDKFADDFLPRSLSAETQAHIKFRLAVYGRDYLQSHKQLSAMLAMQTNPAEWLASQSGEMLSDIGKTMLYGSSAYLGNARICDAAAAEAQGKGNKTAVFYMRFYAGRLYDKASGGNIGEALDRFEFAMQSAPDPEKYDNALWYYFSTALKDSTERAIAALEKYVSTIQDEWYYSDFFETLSQRLLSGSDWEAFRAVHSIIDGFADAETCSKYAYLSGRFLQLGLARTDNAEEAQELARRLFDAAYKPGGALYYRLLAACQLKLTDDEVRSTIYQTKLTQNYAVNADRELLVAGYIAFNLPEEIYREWQENFREISLQTEAAAAHFLSRQSEQKYAAQSLRIMSNAVHHADSQPEEWMYRMAYPRLFAQEIADVCSEFGLSDYVFLGLVRSESFFDPVVTSGKGASGLTQLMPATAGDIARSLKVGDYDLEDPRTNLRFGAFYLADLTRRQDGSVLGALCSYNAGPRRFRSWQELLPELPQDIQLELLPFAETREYGRKVASAAAMYGAMYYGKTASEVVAEIMRL